MTYSNSIPLSYSNHEPLNYYTPEENRMAQEYIQVQPAYEHAPEYNNQQMQMQPQMQMQNHPVVYNQPQNGNINDESQKEGKESSLPVALTGAGIGLVGGAVAGALKKNPYMKNGVPTDTFAQLAYERYLKKAPHIEKKAYDQSHEVLNQIDKMKNTDELKTLMHNNSEAAKELSTALNKTTDEYLSTVADTNLGANKELIKKKLDVANLSRYQYMKNEISRAWDPDKKAFVKPSNMDNNTFKAIRRTSGAVRAKVILTYAAVTAAVTGVLAFATHKIINHRKQRIEQ